MNAPASSSVLHRVAQVKHLVKDHVREDDFRDRDAVQQPADDNRIMRRIEVAEYTARRTVAPTQERPRHQAVEVPEVEILENRLQVVVVALRSGEELATPDLPEQVQTATHLFPVEVH